jgi:hypothetical protein
MVCGGDGAPEWAVARESGVGGHGVEQTWRNAVFFLEAD